ncbi:MAG: hypothetical protein LBC75_08885 [Fibromonadaceae bacterium]|jgi:hypothetical protein|nr:hypothetical protein [Fibromonadaceae bacterium]
MKTKIELEQLAFKIAAHQYAIYRLIRDKNLYDVVNEDLSEANYIKKHIINNYDNLEQETKQGYDYYDCDFSIEQLQEKIIYFIEALDL